MPDYPTETDRVIAALDEIHDLLAEIRDALVPPEQEKCPKCESTHVVKEHHGADYPCGAGPCLRWNGKGEHFLRQCRDCGHGWAAP